MSPLNVLKSQSKDMTREVLSIMDSVLNLEGRTALFNLNTPLLGAQPEIDSMGVVALLVAFEDRLNIAVDDEEIDGSVFKTVGTLVAFVTKKFSA